MLTNLDLNMAILHDHGFETRFKDGKLQALEYWSKGQGVNMVHGSTWVTVPTTRRDLFKWMGY